MNQVLKNAANNQANTDVSNGIAHLSISLPNVQDKPVSLDFNGGLLSSDAGALLLGEWVKWSSKLALSGQWR